VTARPLRIAFSIQPQHADFGAIRDAALAAEELGADLVTVWDHFFPLFGDPDGRHFECWTTLAALAEATSRVELAPLVSPIGVRNPDLLADMARTVDHVSGGRLVLGLGGGWSERDYAEYGYDYGTTRSRLADLESGLERIRHRLAVLNPPAVRPIPVLVGGGGEKVTLRLVARHADIWHANGELDDLVRKSAVLDSWCVAQGRDPATIERATIATPPRAASRSHDTRVDPAVAGPPLLAAGFTLLNVRASGPEFDLGPLREWLAWRDSLTAAG
jgi:probable F420-dependent oxidoreductase